MATQHILSPTFGCLNVTISFVMHPSCVLPPCQLSLPLISEHASRKLEEVTTYLLRRMFLNEPAPRWFSGQWNGFKIQIFLSQAGIISRCPTFLWQMFSQGKVRPLNEKRKGLLNEKRPFISISSFWMGVSSWRIELPVPCILQIEINITSFETISQIDRPLPWVQFTVILSILPLKESLSLMCFLRAKFAVLMA